MRLVVDTNAIVSALLWRGKPYRLFQAAREGRTSLFTSLDIVRELAEVLERPKFWDRIAEANVDAAGLLRRFDAIAQRIRAPVIEAPPELRDPDDLHVLACALAAGADAIVTGDHDLLSLGSFRGIPVITVDAALKKLGVK